MVWLWWAWNSLEHAVRRFSLPLPVWYVTAVTVAGGREVETEIFGRKPVSNRPPVATIFNSIYVEIIYDVFGNRGESDVF